MTKKLSTLEKFNNFCNREFNSSHHFYCNLIVVKHNKNGSVKITSYQATVGFEKEDAK